MSSTTDLDVKWLLSQLTLEENVGLLAGVGRCKTKGIKRLNIPSINVSTGISSLTAMPC